MYIARTKIPIQRIAEQTGLNSAPTETGSAEFAPVLSLVGSHSWALTRGCRHCCPVARAHATSFQKRGEVLRRHALAHAAHAPARSPVVVPRFCPHAWPRRPVCGTPRKKKAPDPARAPTVERPPAVPD